MNLDDNTRDVFHNLIEAIVIVLMFFISIKGCVSCYSDQQETECQEVIERMKVEEK